AFQIVRDGLDADLHGAGRLRAVEILEGKKQRAGALDDLLHRGECRLIHAALVARQADDARHPRQPCPDLGAPENFIGVAAVGGGPHVGNVEGRGYCNSPRMTKAAGPRCSPSPSCRRLTSSTPNASSCGSTRGGQILPSWQLPSISTRFRRQSRDFVRCDSSFRAATRRPRRAHFRSAATPWLSSHGTGSGGFFWSRCANTRTWCSAAYVSTKSLPRCSQSGLDAH